MPTASSRVCVWDVRGAGNRGRAGERFDLRRTLRASLRTGGDALEPRALGHPLRNPRFVVLLDGSRSMSEHAPKMLQFAYALAKRSRRADVFLFSTKLQDVTRNLRDADPRQSYRLDDLGEAWGGGTRIGASLTEFVRAYGARLTSDTFAIVVSDGLDVGEIGRLRARDARTRAALRGRRMAQSRMRRVPATRPPRAAWRRRCRT